MFRNWATVYIYTKLPFAKQKAKTIFMFIIIDKTGQSLRWLKFNTVRKMKALQIAVWVCHKPPQNQEYVRDKPVVPDDACMIKTVVGLGNRD